MGYRADTGQMADSFKKAPISPKNNDERYKKHNKASPVRRSDTGHQGFGLLKGNIGVEL